MAQDRVLKQLLRTLKSIQKLLAQKAGANGRFGVTVTDPAPGDNNVQFRAYISGVTKYPISGTCTFPPASITYKIDGGGEISSTFASTGKAGHYTFQMDPGMTSTYVSIAAHTLEVIVYDAGSDKGSSGAQNFTRVS
jgi:hypothetical protein